MSQVRLNHGIGFHVLRDRTNQLDTTDVAIY